MSKNGSVVILTDKEKQDLKEKINSFPNVRLFCKANKIQAPLLYNPLDRGRCSEKTYKKLLKWKSKEELDVK